MSFARNPSNKYGKQLLDAATKSRLNALKTPTKKVAYKAPEATWGFIANTINDKNAKPKPVPEANSRNAKEIIIPTDKREEIKTSILKWNTTKHLRY